MIMTGSIAVESDGQKPLDGFRFSTRPRFLIKLQTEPQDLKAGDWLVRDHEVFLSPLHPPISSPPFPSSHPPPPSTHPTQAPLHCQQHPSSPSHFPPPSPLPSFLFSLPPPLLSPLPLLSSLIAKSKKRLYKLSRSSFLMCGTDVARLCRGGGGLELDCEYQGWCLEWIVRSLAGGCGVDAGGGGGGLIAIATSFRLDLGFDTNSFIFLLSHFETARLHPSDSDDGVPTVNSQSFIKQKKKRLSRNI